MSLTIYIVQYIASYVVMWAFSYPVMFGVGANIWLTAFMLTCDRQRATLAQAATHIADDHDNFDISNVIETIDSINKATIKINKHWQSSQMCCEWGQRR